MTMPESSASPTGGDPLDLAQIQGLVLRGYSYFTIRHFILKIEDVEHARAFCGALCPGGGGAMEITTAEDWQERPAYCLNVGITNTGLQALIGADAYADVLNLSYSIFASFDTGASDPGTAVTVGDTGTSAPQNWWPQENPPKDGPLEPDDLHLLVSLYTRHPGDRERFSEILLAAIPESAPGKPALVPVFVQDADLLPPPPPKCAHSGLQIHFGYADGFSQPRIAGAPGDDPGEDAPCVPAAYFVISKDGAPNYYDAPHPLLVNGSFSAFRLLEQDVEGFENFLDLAEDRELLAAKMCGRWRDGTPLEVSPDKPDLSLSTLDILNFDYLAPTLNQKGPRTPDPLGQACPYAAHTRRANPRDDGGVIGNTEPDGITPAYAVQHRIRRFATPYGPEYTPGTGDTPRGLVGHFMGANLAEQFEFLMSTWINTGFFRQPDASPNGSGVDPLFGPQPGENADFSRLDPAGDYETTTPMTQFIVTKGGLYLFLPSVAALQAISTGRIPSPPAG